MTDCKSTPEGLTAASGNIRTGLAVVSMIAMLTLGTAVTALAGGGGVGTGGGGGGGGGGGAGGDRYDREWDSFSAKDKKWAHKTSYCESGEDPNIHDPSGSYHGAFQFLRSTWKTSPMSPGGDPHRYSWKTQAVVAVKLKHRQGSSPWPQCG